MSAPAPAWKRLPLFCSLHVRGRAICPKNRTHIFAVPLPTSACAPRQTTTQHSGTREAQLVHNRCDGVLEVEGKKMQPGHQAAVEQRLPELNNHSHHASCDATLRGRLDWQRCVATSCLRRGLLLGTFDRRPSATFFNMNKTN